MPASWETRQSAAPMRTLTQRGALVTSLAAAAGTIASGPTQAEVATHPLRLVSESAQATDIGLAACGVHDLEVAPDEWSPGCAGASPIYRNLQWLNWNAGTTTATGVALLNTCDPDCVSGDILEYPVTLTAADARPCGSRPSSRQYRRLTASVLYPIDNPFGVAPGAHETTWRPNAAACTVLVPVFEQGVGVTLAKRPLHLDAKRNVAPGSITGLDGWTVKWRSFGGRIARGRGTYFWNSPDHTRVRRYASRITLRRVRPCGTLYRYTRIRGTFINRRPPGMPRTVRMKTYAPDC
jgi:hypothetical protein